MTDLKQFIADLGENMETEKTAGDIVAFFEDNKWFGVKLSLSEGKIMLSDKQMDIFRKPLIDFLKAGSTQDILILSQRFYETFNTTSKYLNKFFIEISATEETMFYIRDFLLYELDKEIFLYTDKEVSVLVEKATNSLIKSHGDIFTFFLSWLKSKCKTNYHNEYIMTKRISLEYKNQAYDFDEYLELLYYLYNEDYILENDMYQKATKSKNYADTWLFLSLHFICALRTTDMERIKHPYLPIKPEEVLQQIEDDTFDDKTAREVLFSITYRLCLLPLEPNKTSSHNNISSFKFTVPESCEVHIGKLFAICEAHRIIAGISDYEPLIRRISDYDRIERYMGEEIGSLFLEANFRTRSANKSYLQSVFMLTDDILEQKEGPNIKGYVLAALARSHKGAYGEFATTTATYLKDAKFNGLSAEFVAMELFERGVLSFIPSMLLKMITGGEYNKLSSTNQTRLIQSLNMTPAEIENTVALSEKARKQAENVIKELSLDISDENTILEVLHRIGNGSAFSKNPENLCILSAIRKICPYDNKRVCVGCQYEISTKSTLYLMISEYNRLSFLYDSVHDGMEKEKYRNILTQIVIPKFDELLTCIKEQYGEEVFHTYEQMIKENIL